MKLTNWTRWSPPLPSDRSRYTYPAVRFNNRTGKVEVKSTNVRRALRKEERSDRRHNA